MALPLSALVMGRVSAAVLSLVVGQQDDCQDQRQELDKEPQGCQEQGYAAQSLHLRQAHAPGIPQIHPALPPQVRLCTLQPQSHISAMKHVTFRHIRL